MNKEFCVSFFLLVFLYLNVSKINEVITIIGVIIFISQLSQFLTSTVLHSKYFPKLYVSPTNRLVVITGCDSGFGLRLAKRLDKYGFYILAGVLSKESDGCRYLENHSSKRLCTVKLDVTKQDDINEIIDLVAYLTGQKSNLINSNKLHTNVFGNVDGHLSLWALINNAGVAQFTPLEFGTVEQDLLPLFEVNVFGVMRMTRALLPFIRKSEGRIVNVGSVSDRLTFGGLTCYSMTKHAIRSMTDGLRQELSRFNIKAILVEPTLYKTPISDIDHLVKQFDRCYDRTHTHIRSQYGDEEFRESYKERLRSLVVLSRTQINEVIDALEDSVINRTPRNQYWCASSVQKFLFYFINQMSIEFTDHLGMARPSNWLIDFCVKINEID